MKWFEQPGFIAETQGKKIGNDLGIKSPQGNILYVEIYDYVANKQTSVGVTAFLDLI